MIGYLSEEGRSLHSLHSTVHLWHLKSMSPGGRESGIYPRIGACKAENGGISESFFGAR